MHIKHIVILFFVFLIINPLSSQPDNKIEKKTQQPIQQKEIQKVLQKRDQTKQKTP